MRIGIVIFCLPSFLEARKQQLKEGIVNYAGTIINATVIQKEYHSAPDVDSVGVVKKIRGKGREMG